MPNKKKTKKYPLAQNGYVAPDIYQNYLSIYGQPNGYLNPEIQPINGVLPEAQVTAQGNPQQRYYGIQEPQLLPVNNQPPIGQPINVPELKYTSQEQPNNEMWKGIGRGAQQFGQAAGQLISGSLQALPQLINALSPDNRTQRTTPIQFAYNQDPYGAQQYNNMFENGGKLAQNGKTIYVNNANDPRYKAYQDSLAANNLSNSLIRNMRSNNPNNPEWVVYGPKKSFARELTQGEALDEAMKKVAQGYTEEKVYISPFSNSGKYKNWQSGKYMTMDVPGEINTDSQGRLYPSFDYYDPPQQRVAIDPTPQVSNVSRIPSLGMNSTSRPQGRQIQWDNVVNDGVFPVYGLDNMLQGMWDTDRNNQVIFYPRNGQTEIPRGLPSNTLIQNPYPTPTNVREMEKGGQLSPSKAKTMLRENQANGKKLTPKQKRYFGYIAGGGKAAQGATVTNYGIGELPKNLTPAQQAALQGTIPYTPSIERIQPQAISDFGYYSPNVDGTFAINVGRHLMDRNAPSGRIGDTYSYGTNRSYAYEGIYGNRDYQPQMFMNTGYNRYFENGGMVNNTGYLDNASTANNPMNIIPGQNGITNITMDGVSQPIIANGQVLPPNSGNYLFPTESVVEQQLYKAGKTYDLSQAEIENLKNLGYDIEIS